MSQRALQPESHHHFGRCNAQGAKLKGISFETAIIERYRQRESSLELRSRKALIENFIAGINDVEDVFLEWRKFVMRQKEQELTAIIAEEKLKPKEDGSSKPHCKLESSKPPEQILTG